MKQYNIRYKIFGPLPHSVYEKLGAELGREHLFTRIYYITDDTDIVAIADFLYEWKDVRIIIYADINVTAFKYVKELKKLLEIRGVKSRKIYDKEYIGALYGRIIGVES